MRQPSLFPLRSLSVSQLSRYLRELMDSDEILRDIWVQGEISNLSRPSSGHIYFTLKDASSALKCVIWKNAAMRLPIILQSGMAVEAHGAVSIYERDGQYQLYVDAVRMSGEGALYQEFMRLKSRLEAEGLFDPDRKREIPIRPQIIGIVTSPTGAALQDMLNTLRRRYPLAEVLVSPAPVQGEEAPPALVEAIRRLNETAGVDVILLARGGGSLEDLWAFNDERVVRAVAASRVPVVTGIGHETDFTLCDFAADLRAPTPTAAAELCTPDQSELRDDLASLAYRLGYSMQQVTSYAWFDLLELRHKLENLSPQWMLRDDRQRLDETFTRMEFSMRNTMRDRRVSVEGLQDRLTSLNPFAVLKRGYAVVTDASGAVVSSVTQVHEGENLDIKFSDGGVKSQVTQVTGGTQDVENG